MFIVRGLQLRLMVGWILVGRVHEQAMLLVNY